jgi:hypothetical protein
MSVNLPTSISFHAVGIFNVTDMGPMAVLRIFIAIKNPSSSAGFEPANLGYNGKHDKH